VKRYAAAVGAGDPRVLDIDSVYASEWMRGAHILVTGANRGIGLSLVWRLCAAGRTCTQSAASSPRSWRP